MGTGSQAARPSKRSALARCFAPTARGVLRDPVLAAFLTEKLCRGLLQEDFFVLDVPTYVSTRL